jgi:two-component system chemotaxis response regulator CheB
MIKVLVVDDSSVEREFLSHILASDPNLEVVATARNGREAIEAIQKQRPDVITMDIHMPIMDGVEATRHIMSTSPIPIVIISSSSNRGEAEGSFRILEAGALTILQKPVGPGHANYQASVTKLVNTVKLMSEVKLVKRHFKPSLRRLEVGEVEAATDQVVGGPPRLVAIGTSTGGPQTLMAILPALPADFPVPIVIVQHVASGFLPVMVDWLSNSCKLSISIAKNDERLQPGQIYFAPDGLQMGIRRGGTVLLSEGDKQNGHIPSVSWLFSSVADVYGPNAVGILLTGMGRDGADGLRQMKDRGALTIAQDEESSIIFGMPAAAIQLDAASCVLGLEQIVARLIASVDQGQHKISTSGIHDDSR